MTDDVRPFVLRAVEEPSEVPAPEATARTDAGVGPDAGSAFVLVPEGDLRSRLITELVRLGYQARIVNGGDPPTDEAPAVVFIAAPHGMSEAVQRSEALRTREALGGVPVLWLVPAEYLGEITNHEHLVDDFLGWPWPAAELEARLRLLQRREPTFSTGDDDEVIRRGPLAMNVATYQVALEGRKLDLTFMEYELLKLFMTYPGRVYRREEILERVWGYDYFGGMRTVDVHVRRVRAKLGQDHAWLVETIRSVGYRMATLRP